MNIMPDELRDGEATEIIAPVIPRDSATGHSGLVADCPPHALPFGIIFEEYAARRGGDLKQHASEVLGVEPDRVLSELHQRLIARDSKYNELEQAKASPQTPPSTIDKLERECCQLDWPLKRLLHKMNGSALCMSGGGIRSASFGLGVLEGLARFSVGLLSPAQGLTREPHREHAGCCTPWTISQRFLGAGTSEAGSRHGFTADERRPVPNHQVGSQATATS